MSNCQDFSTFEEFVTNHVQEENVKFLLGKQARDNVSDQ
jgi:hypothetical protein